MPGCGRGGRQSASPAPGGSGGGGRANKSQVGGDPSSSLVPWFCGACGKQNSGDRRGCHSCRWRLAPSSREKAFQRGPDWQCGACNFETNFSKRTTCYRCGDPRPPSQHVRQREPESSPARGQQAWTKPQPSANTLGGWFQAELQNKEQKEQNEKRLQRDQLQAAKHGESASHTGGPTPPPWASVAATVPVVSVKDRIAALEATIATLGSSDPDVAQLKAKKETEVLQLRAQLESERPLRSRLQLATEGRDRMVNVLKSHRQDITTLEYFLGLKRDLVKQSEEELAVRVAEAAALSAEYEIEIAQAVLPAPLTPAGALQQPPLQPLSPAHWAAGLSAALSTVDPGTAANFAAWLQTQMPRQAARHITLEEVPNEEWDEEDDFMNGGGDAALAAGLVAAGGGSPSPAGSQPGAALDAARMWMGKPAGGAFGAAARTPRRRPEPFETAVKVEPPASPAPANGEDASESSDEALLAACKRVELAAAGAKAAEVMERMGGGAAAASTA